MKIKMYTNHAYYLVTKYYKYITIILQPNHKMLNN